MNAQYCTGLIDIANAALLCLEDDDCAGLLCAGAAGKDRCDVDGSCVCDGP